jgi:RNA-directed DNA polymerase
VKIDEENQFKLGEIFDNQSLKTVEYFNKNIPIINTRCISFLNKGIWPMTNIELKIDAMYLLEQMQVFIASIGSQGKQELALEFIQKWVFTAFVRLIVIDIFRVRKSSFTTGCDGLNIESSKDFVKCFLLFYKSHPKDLEMECNMKVRYVEIPKADGKSKRILGIANLYDRIVQYQFYLFLDPLVENTILPEFFGFRKGRSSLQAIAKLSQSIANSDLNFYWLISLDIEKCFDNINHDYIYNNFPFPLKYKKLLTRWLKVKVIMSDGSIHKKQIGIAQGSVIAPLICNFVLSRCFENFFSDPFFKKHPTVINARGNKRSKQVVRFLIGYADDLIFKVINESECNYAISLIKEKLFKVGLSINLTKTLVMNLMNPTRFDWLGYTFVSKHSKYVYKGGILSKDSRLNKIRKKWNKHFLLLYMSDKNFTKIKDKLKFTIKEALRVDLLSVMKKVNEISRGISNYYSFANNASRLSFLRSFIDRNYWKVLVQKFRFKGVRRTRAIAHKFFLTNNSPLNYKWHLHLNIGLLSKDFKKRKGNYYWSTDVSRYFKMLPISKIGIPKKLERINYYLYQKEFEINRTNIYKLRSIKYKTPLSIKLLIKQNCKCYYCLQEIEEIDEVEIHHLIRIKDVNTNDKKELLNINKIENLRLIHKICHKDVHS